MDNSNTQKEDHLGEMRRCNSCIHEKKGKKICLANRDQYVIIGDPMKNGKPGQVYDECSSYRSYLEVASDLFHQGKFKEAINDLEKALKHDPDKVQVYKLLGYAHYRTKKYKKALEFINKAYEINPQNEEIDRFLGLLYKLTKQYEKAVEHIEAFLKKDPNDANNLIVLGNAYWELKRFSHAEEAYKRANKVDPHNKLAWDRRIALLKKTGQKAKRLEAMSERRKVGKSGVIVDIGGVKRWVDL